MLGHLEGKAVLITGGTMGIGLATGLAFGRHGAHCTLTHKWGTADEDEIRRRFAEVGAPPPSIISADVSLEEDTVALLEGMRRVHDRVEAFVSNVSVVPVISENKDYEKRSLFKSIEYSAWPLFAYTQRIKEIFGRYPRYVVGISSGGVDAVYKNYDFVAASKAVMETLCRYMSYQLFDERFIMERQFIPAEEVANAVLALCSGLLDGVRGQVIMVDRGTTFFDNVMRLYNEREALRI